MEITKEMIIHDILMARPDSAEILIAHGMGCVGCPSSQMETLEEAALVHGMNLDILMSALNK
ncbi:MAG: hypothetical protein K0Q97_1950 [Bacillota bacterium]|jgi:hybrid cluster-associated redox disulfide protein|nr:hypothetical protein [Bacillota bacterium]